MHFMLSSRVGVYAFIMKKKKKSFVFSDKNITFAKMFS